MEICIGEYVRTKDGYIFKILTKENTNYGCCGITDSNNTKYTTYTYNKRSFNDIKNKIVKHSKNIIDLIEVGDIVVMLDTKFNTKDYIFIDDIEMLQAVRTDLKDRCKLISILTKEQYHANCYTVERKE